MKILIKADKRKFPRIHKALERGHELILRPSGDAYVVTNLYINKRKNGAERVELFNHKTHPWEGREVGLTRNILTLTFNGQTFSAAAESIDLQEA
jgi:hypothetical protein